MYIRRVIEETLAEYLKSFCAIGITGPRQAGKTTLIQNALPNYQYVSMDEYRNLEFFNNDPEGFIEKYNDKIIFDEVHYTPKLFNFIKNAIDKDRQNYGKFILTSSSQFSYLQGITESLAGRIGLISLLPMQIHELPYVFHNNCIIRGSYPELIANPAMNRNHWYDSYISTYLDKDIRQISNIGNMNDFRRFIGLLAARTGQIFDMQDFAKKIGVSSPTIKHWTSILEASYIIFLLPPYYENFGKRIIKRPKLYFYDIGLVCYLTGIETFEHYNNGPMAGSIFENYVMSEILKDNLHKKTHAKLYFIRTSNGEEVDIVIDNKQTIKMVEIKKTSTFIPKFSKVLQTFLDKSDKKAQGYFLYNGKNDEYKNIKITNFVDFVNDKYTQ